MAGGPPLGYLNAYLRTIYEKSLQRGYRFYATKLGRVLTQRRISDTGRQVAPTDPAPSEGSVS